MYLYGASGHCKVIMDIIKSSTDKTIEGVFDDNSEESEILNIPILRYNSFLQREKIKELIICIGNNKIRKKIAEEIKTNFFTAIHFKTSISENATIDKGTVVMANVVVNASAQIGKHCIINSGAVVEHDCKLADYVHISPNAALAGNVEVGEGTHIGIGAQVIQGTKIGKWATVGAGAVILKDVPDYATMVGNPAKQIK